MNPHPLSLIITRWSDSLDITIHNRIRTNLQLDLSETLWILTGSNLKSSLGLQDHLTLSEIIWILPGSNLKSPLGLQDLPQVVLSRCSVEGEDHPMVRIISLVHRGWCSIGVMFAKGWRGFNRNRFHSTCYLTQLVSWLGRIGSFRWALGLNLFTLSYINKSGPSNLEPSELRSKSGLG